MKKRIVTRWKRPLAAALGALFVLSAVCGAGNTLPESVRDALPEGVREVLAPVTVQAAGNDPAMSQGAEVLKATANTNSAQTVYYAGNPWRVIAYGTDGNEAGASGALTLFSADCLTTSRFNPDNGGDCNDYAGSELKTSVDNLFNGTSAIFDPKERAAVLQRTLEVGEYTGSRPYSTGVSGSATSGHLWPLSTAEALALPSDTFREANNYWWLRSPGFNDYFAAYVYYDGFVYYIGNYVDLCLRRSSRFLFES